MNTFLSLLLCITSCSLVFGVDQGLEKVLAKYRSTYLEKVFVSKIDPDEIDLILEIGVCEGFDSILLHRYYNCPVYAFECNPRAFPGIKARVSDFPDIHLVEKAVSDQTGVVSFYDSYWIADSSLYQFNLSTLADINKGRWNEMKHMYDHQKKIQVPATRLDDWCRGNNIDEISLICMDVQGATLSVLKGLGQYLQKVKYIITEVEYRPVYDGEPLFNEILDFMKKNGFECFNASSAAGAVSNDVLFVRKDLL